MLNFLFLSHQRGTVLKSQLASDSGLGQLTVYSGAKEKRVISAVWTNSEWNTQDSAIEGVFIKFSESLVCVCVCMCV